MITQKLASIKYNFKKIVLNSFLSVKRLWVKVEKNLMSIARKDACRTLFAGLPKTL